MIEEETTDEEIAVLEDEQDEEAEKGPLNEPEDDESTEAEVDEQTSAVDFPLISIVEALLFASRSPVKLSQIARCAGRGIRRDKVCEAIDALNLFYNDSERAFEIVEVAEKFQLMSRPEFSPYLRKLLGKKESTDKERKLSPAALDSLSIIAYKQPVTRVEIETIRGVSCGPVLRSLIERGSVRVIGKKMDVIGQPLLYGTTEEFIKEFGLSSLEQLPMIQELRRATGTSAELPEQRPVEMEGDLFADPVEKPDDEDTEEENQAEDEEPDDGYEDDDDVDEPDDAYEDDDDEEEDVVVDE